MQRTKDATPLRFRSRTGKIPHLLALLLLAVASVTQAQELLSALAPVSYDQPFIPTSILTVQSPTTNPLGYAPTPRLQYQLTTGQTERLDLAAFSVNSLTGKRSGLDLHDWSQQIIKKAGEAETSFWTHLEAGYGQFCQLESFSGRDTIALEQPSFAYLKARFSF